MRAQTLVADTGTHTRIRSRALGTSTRTRTRTRVRMRAVYPYKQQPHCVVFELSDAEKLRRRRVLNDATTRGGTSTKLEPYLHVVFRDMETRTKHLYAVKGHLVEFLLSIRMRDAH